jgi:protein-tyrosine phosphatase
VSSDPLRINFVCLGNICRSPLGEAVLRHLAELRGIGHRMEIASSGTGGWHVGEPANRHSIAIAKKHGIDLRGHRAQQLQRGDLDRYDWLLAMDRTNLSDIETLRARGQRAQARLLLDFAPEVGTRDVPDPYYGGPEGFEHVFQLVHAACEGFLDHLGREGWR